MRHYLASLFAFATFAALPLVGHAQQAEGPYALEGCKKGCVFAAATHDTVTLFSGAVPRTYRVCARNPFVNLVVDNAEVRLRDGDCSDVNGRQIKLFKGEVVFGLLPS